MDLYQLTLGASIIRKSDGATIPADPSNSDYQAYQAWIKAGNTPDPMPAATNQELVNKINAKYLPQFQQLQQSYAAALLTNNAAAQMSIQQSYQTLQAQYNQAISEIKKEGGQ
jgi:hypothetical protein